MKEIWERPLIEFADDNSFVNKRASREFSAKAGRRECPLVRRDGPLHRPRRGASSTHAGFGMPPGPHWPGEPSAESLDGVGTEGQLEDEDREGTTKRPWIGIQSHGIRVIGCFVLGFNGDTPDIFGQVDGTTPGSFGSPTYRSLSRHPFPGPPCTGASVDEGRILKDGAWELCTLFDINFLPKNMSVEELQEGFLWLAEKIYSAEETEARNRRFGVVPEEFSQGPKTVRWDARGLRSL